MGIEFRRGEAFVAGKSAAVDAFRDHHGFGAAPREFNQCLALAQVLSATGDVYRNGGVLRREVEAVHQVSADKAHRVVEVQARFAEVLYQSQGAGAGVAVDRVEAATTGVEQGTDKFLTLVLGLLGVAFGGEGLAAAQVVLVVGEDHLVAGFFQQATGFVVQRHLLFITCCRAHGA